MAYKIGVDVGGTFTDFLLAEDDGTAYIYKVLSTPKDPSIATILKRGMASGYAGVENPLFYLDNTRMLYGDAQKVMVAMIQAVKSLEGGAH